MPFKRIEEYQNIAVPPKKILSAARIGWQNFPVGYMMEDCLVDIRSEFATIAGSNYPFKSNPSIPGSVPYLFVRCGIIKKLCAVDRYLRTHGLELFVLDAWRAPETHTYLSSVLFPRVFRASRASANEKTIQREAGRYLDVHENEDYILSPPAHSTGAVVDLTIRTCSGEYLPMGSSYGEYTKESHIDAFEGTRNVFQINRRLLYGVMSEVGFVGHPYKWWHYSCGDQVWAITHARRHGSPLFAPYGAIDPTPFLHD